MNIKTIAEKIYLLIHAVSQDKRLTEAEADEATFNGWNRFDEHCDKHNLDQKAIIKNAKRRIK